MSYEPTDRDRMWFRLLLNFAREGQLVVFPDSLLMYKVWVAKRCLVLLNPQALGVVEARKIHEMTIATVESLGWSVIEAKSTNDGKDV